MYLKHYAEIIKNLAESYPNLRMVQLNGNEFSPIYYQPAFVENIEIRSGTKIKEAICVN